MTGVKRDTNLELYRIFCMLLIVAHHYVVNSGLLAEILNPLPLSAKSAYLYVLGMWGKVGINCFLMITGYFMCVSRITLRKFIKILAEIYFLFYCYLHHFSYCRKRDPLYVEGISGFASCT